MTNVVYELKSMLNKYCNTYIYCNNSSPRIQVSIKYFHRSEFQKVD